MLSAYFLADGVLLPAVMVLYARANKLTFSRVLGYIKPLPIWSFVALAGAGAVWSIAFRGLIQLRRSMISLTG